MGDKLVEWLFGVMASPVKTLDEIAREKPIGWALLVYFGVTILVFLANLYGDQGLRGLTEVMAEFDLYISTSVIIFGGLAFAGVSVFIFTGLLHLLAKLFGGRGLYWNFFCAFCFADFPMIIIVPVTLFAFYFGTAGSILSGLITFGLSVWVIVLQVIALRESHGLSTGASIGAYIIYFAILIVIPVAIIVALVAALLIAV